MKVRRKKAADPIEVPLDLALMSLMQALRLKDPYTFGHCARVGRLAGKLAASLGLSRKEQIQVELAATFHDIGKIAVPDAILLKPARLTPEEEAIMRLHPIQSVEILQNLGEVPLIRDLLPGIRHHHEQPDGRGYPDGLSGPEIPLASKIILVVDTYDAITSERPYRGPRPPEIAYSELQKYAGTQFDEFIVKKFLKEHPSWAEELTPANPIEIFKKTG
jgi:putative nucleotidyltransferase with HDIG domain